jgi:hypothetical protein
MTSAVTKISKADHSFSERISFWGLILAIYFAFFLLGGLLFSWSRLWVGDSHLSIRELAVLWAANSLTFLAFGCVGLATDDYELEAKIAKGTIKRMGVFRAWELHICIVGLVVPLIAPIAWGRLYPQATSFGEFLMLAFVMCLSVAVFTLTIGGIVYTFRRIALRIGTKSIIYEQLGIFGMIIAFNCMLGSLLYIVKETSRV